jgi:hypothetical protein
MTITHPDQMAKLRDCETDNPIFPKGICQLLGWSYGMEGVDPHERTAHDKLIEKIGDGYIRPFHVSSINVSGLDPIEKYGMAAGIRERVERSLTEEQRDAIWARYCDSTCPRSGKCDGMGGVAVRLHGELRRTREMVADCCWHIVCTDRERESCSMHDIARQHGVGIGTVHRTIVKMRLIMREWEEQAEKRLRKVFATVI